MQLQLAIVRAEAVRCADYKYMVLDCVLNLGTMEMESADTLLLSFLFLFFFCVCFEIATILSPEENTH